MQTGHRSPRTRIQAKFRNSLGDKVLETQQEVCVKISGTNAAEKSVLKKYSDIVSDTRKVVKKEQENVIKADLPFVRRSKSDTIGMRRSSPRDENGPDTIIMKNTKENIACQLMNLAVGSSETMKNPQNSMHRISDSSCRSESIDAMNRVLKDSNVEKGMHVHQTSR